MGNLTAVRAKSINTAGRYPDGNGLMLVCKASGAKSWILRVQHEGRRRDFGLGSYPTISLSDARERAVETRKQLRAGEDPSELRKNSGRISAQIRTFEELSTQFHAERKEGWKNAKHADQWLSTLKQYAFPKIGASPVDGIGSKDVHGVLAPIWHSKPETARRVFQRIMSVLNYAHSLQMREHEAPARSVKAGLGNQRVKATHFASLPYDEMPNLFSALSAKQSVGALALRFTILTAARSGEVRGAMWSEIDFAKKIWTIPAERMKAGVQHRIPLSKEAIRLLREAQKLRKAATGLVFPSTVGGALSDMTLLKAIRSATEHRVTVHGCRSSFRVWAAERTRYPAAAAEAALAHTIQNKAEAAYHRTDYLEIRTGLMADWADHLTSVNADQLAP